MSVRKRTWPDTDRELKNGTIVAAHSREAWVVDYVDGEGKRRQKTFKRKKDADVYAATASVEVRKGTHVADSASVTVAEAGKKWIEASEEGGLERATIAQYKQHVDYHITPYIGSSRLTQLSIPFIRAFEKRLSDEGRSRVMISKVVGSLGSLLAEAQEQGLVAHNAVRDMRRSSRRKRKGQPQSRRKKRLEAGIDFPTNAEIKKIVHTVRDRWRPLLITAIFTGMRASELRGVTWTDVDFDNRLIRVRQRADRFNQIGPPKSETSSREIPLSPLPLNTLREWKLKCPQGGLGLVFPNGSGNVESLGNIINRGLIPTQVSAVVSMPKLDSKGEQVLDKKSNPVMTGKYSGMHALRHFYASWCINRKEQGGIGLPPKVVQERLGHSSITMTMDVYGHLFPRGDDSKELADAESALLA